MPRRQSSAAFTFTWPLHGLTTPARWPLSVVNVLPKSSACSHCSLLGWPGGGARRGAVVVCQRTGHKPGHATSPRDLWRFWCAEVTSCAVLFGCACLGDLCLERSSVSNKRTSVASESVGIRIHYCHDWLLGRRSEDTSCASNVERLSFG